MIWRFYYYVCAGALAVSPAVAQHTEHSAPEADVPYVEDIHDGAHHVATPQEIEDNAEIGGLLERVQGRAPNAQTRSVWAAIRDATRAKMAKDRPAFDNAVHAAKVLLAQPAFSSTAPALTPVQSLTRAYSNYLALHARARIELDVSPSVPTPKKKYYEAPAVTRALKLVYQFRKCAQPACPTTVQIRAATKALDAGSATLTKLIRNPYL